MQIQVDGLPDGSYTVELVSAEELPPPEDHEDWGPSAELTVMVVGGDYDGNVVADRMGYRVGKKARFGKLVRGIIGRDLQPGEALDISQYYGRRYTLLAEVSDGRTRFLNFVSVPD